MKKITLIIFLFTSYLAKSQDLPVYLVSEYALGSKIIAISDKNNDNDFDDAGEKYLYFGANNLSNVGSFTGLQGETAFQDILVAKDNNIDKLYLADISTKSIYVGQDINNDGDLQDNNEVTVWFSEADNVNNYSLETITAIEKGPDGAIYLLKAGVIAPGDENDRVYRTEDLNGDGDANDAGEATIYIDDGEFPTLSFGSFSFPHSFTGLDMTFYQDDLYILESAIDSGAGQIYKTSDADSNQTIENSEFSVFFKSSSYFSLDTEQVIQKLTSDTNGLYILHEPFEYYDNISQNYIDFAANKRKLFLLKDNNSNGSIQNSEVSSAWDATNLPTGKRFYRGWGTAINETGDLLLSSVDDRGNPPNYAESNIWLVRNGQTSLLLDGPSSGSLDIKNPRGVAFTVKKDVLAPVVTMNPISSIGLWNQSNLTLSGTCNSNDGNVTVVIVGISPDQTTSCINNIWSMIVDVSSIADAHDAIQITARQTDPANNTGTSNVIIASKNTIPQEIPSLTIWGLLSLFVSLLGLCSLCAYRQLTIR